MKNNFKNTNFIILSLAPIILIILGVIFWDNIKIPYNDNNIIYGEYFIKKYNPFNDILRFILVILVPSILYLFLLINFRDDSYNLKPSSNNFFLIEKDLEKNVSLNKISLIFYFYLILEFICIDFNHFVSLEFYHDAGFLVAPKNYLFNKSLNNTSYDYGFFAYNIGLIWYYLFGYYSVASIKIIKLILLLLVKFFLVILSKQLISSLNFSGNLKKIFYFLFTFLIINLPDYYDPGKYFAERSLLYIAFLTILISAFTTFTYKMFKFFLVGVFSLLNLFWWWDIGIYTNLMIIVALLLLLFTNKKKEIIFLFSGIIFSWGFVFLFFPTPELFGLFSDLKEYIFNASYALGIKYPKPFSIHSSRATKALLFVFICSIFLINLNFLKKNNINFSTKICLNFIFVSSIIFFNSALTRSDSGHIKYSSGFYTLLLIFFIMHYFFLKINNNELIKNYFIKFKILILNKVKKIKVKIFFFLFFLLLLFSFKNPLIINVKKIKNFKNDFNQFIMVNDYEFLKNEHLQKVYNNKINYLEILEHYKNISKDDSCIQVLTADVSFPYFLDKPSCTKFYNTVTIITNKLENIFVEQLKEASPEIILFESPVKLLTIKTQPYMNTVHNYIRENYKFFQNYKGFIFYKKKI